MLVTMKMNATRLHVVPMAVDRFSLHGNEEHYPHVRQFDKWGALVGVCPPYTNRLRAGEAMRRWPVIFL
jgi:hypothetical protein